MRIASAKITIALLGLLCSILFILVLRKHGGALDRALHTLCFALDRRLVFVSQEDLAFVNSRQRQNSANISVKS